MWETIYTGSMKTLNAPRVTRHDGQKSARYTRKSCTFFSLLTCYCFVLFFMLSACSTTHYAYSKGIFDGKGALKRGDYTGAKRSFEDAYQNDKSPDALMYLAIVDYKTNNLDSAERLIRAAEAMGSGNYHYLRVLGYKALILLKKSRDQGLEALDHYVAFYALHDPLMSINDIHAMAQSGNIDGSRLENLIEEQVSWYESDIELYMDSGVGYYDARDFIGGSFRFHRGGAFR